jgi:hypothetical protein
MTDWDLLIQSYMRIGPSKSMNKSLRQFRITVCPLERASGFEKAPKRRCQRGASEGRATDAGRRRLNCQRDRVAVSGATGSGRMETDLAQRRQVRRQAAGAQAFPHGPGHYADPRTMPTVAI